MTTNQAETKSDPQSLVGTTMTVLQGKHKGRTATILKLCPKRIKVTVDMPASHIAKGDVYLQPQALGLDRWYPNGLLLDTTIPITDIATSQHVFEENQTTAVVLPIPGWPLDNILEQHLKMITARLAELGMGNNVTLSINVNHPIHSNRDS